MQNEIYGLMEGCTKIPEKVHKGKRGVDVLDFLQEAPLRLMHEAVREQLKWRLVGVGDSRNATGTIF